MTNQRPTYKAISPRKFLLVVVFCVFTALMAYQWRTELQVYHMFINGSLSSLTFIPPSPATLNSSQNATDHFLWTTDASRVSPQQASKLSPTSTKIQKTSTPSSRNSSTTTTPKHIPTTLTTSSNHSTTTTTPRPILTTPPPAPKPIVCKNPFRKEYIKKQNFLCCRPIGRLGNMMFVYASSYGIAASNNRTLIVDKGLSLTKYFNLNAQLVDDYNCVITGTRGMGSRQDCAFDERLMNITKGQNTCVGSYLQSYKYFEHVREAIKKQFIFKKEIRDKAMGIINGAINTFHNRNTTLKDTRPVLVGVHVRRGDMVKNKFGYAVATPEYLGNATQYYRDKFPNRLFIVCSNDMAWTKQHVVGDDVFYVEGNTFEVDMAVLVSCNHSLTTVGSFSWWAGFLAGGQVVYYQWPAIEKSGLRRHFSANYTDFFPPSWIGM
ncbi:galactoside alpha-(1,2)-fucosyltransferase 2-like [Haliotis cracherodii]|uniref:galactoside alpha-(1,2)-fucosyltransferase 2-like n=1 Tax=Haliotis cracherodii TaxID=6455 RepID=UPI0039ED5A04